MVDMESEPRTYGLRADAASAVSAGLYRRDKECAAAGNPRRAIGAGGGIFRRVPKMSVNLRRP
jgi:hypothetical protein